MDRVASFLIEEMKEQRNYYEMFREIFYERSQLYGALIRLMYDRSIDEVVFSYDDLKLANNFILKFTPDDETKGLKIELVDNPDKENKKDE